MAETESQKAQDFSAFYQKYAASTHRYVYTHLHSHEEAEDLTADIFLKAWRDLDLARNEAALQMWLFHVTWTTLADYGRAHARDSTTSLERLQAQGWRGSEASRVSVNQAARDQVQQLLAVLPETYRTVLTYRFLLQYSLRETARAMGITLANVKVLQFRALKRAASLGSDGPRQ
jgi:RNA polymerase sigma factor (sigma-70 family)